MISSKTVFNIDVAKWCVALLTSSYNKHIEIKKKAARLGIEGNYFRLDVPQGMSKIGLADWDKIKDMIALTDKYMDDNSEEKVFIAKRLLNPSSAS
jgi:hypothetical protein